MLYPSLVNWFNMEYIKLKNMTVLRCDFLLPGRQSDRDGERAQKIYKWWDQNQTDTNRYNSLTSRQLVILETSWAPWQQRMNPARLRSTHTTDSRTNTLTWRCRHGRGGVKKGREDGLLWEEHLCLNLWAHSVNKTFNKQDVIKWWETVTEQFQGVEM